MLLSWFASHRSQLVHANHAISFFCSVTVFQKMPNINSINSMIRAHVLKGHHKEAIELYHQMNSPRSGMKPDTFTFPFVLKACSHLSDSEQGKLTHSMIIKCGMQSNLYVGSALVDMYCKCGFSDEGRKVFDRMPDKNVVTWTAMISGYTQNGNWGKSLELFKNIAAEENCGNVNAITIASVLPAIPRAGTLSNGKEIHCLVIKRGMYTHPSVVYALLYMYAKLGTIKCTISVFNSMPMRDVISFNTMLAKYVQEGYSHSAFGLFRRMPTENSSWDSVSLIKVLQACAYLSLLQQGSSIHGLALKKGIDTQVDVGTALLDMYAKCGNVEFAYQVFNCMSQRDVVTWTGIISGFGLQGLGHNALQMFKEMRNAGIMPNHITFVALLSACRHAGLVDEGLHYFSCMKDDYGISPCMEHYAALVDLLGRSGHFVKACEFIKGMPFLPDSSIWGALINSCRTHGNVDVGLWAAENVLKMNIKDTGLWVMIANFYAEAGKWSDFAKMRVMIKESKSRKNPGCSWIEVDSKIHVFYVGDSSLPYYEEIFEAM